MCWVQGAQLDLLTHSRREPAATLPPSLLSPSQGDSLPGDTQRSHPTQSSSQQAGHHLSPAAASCLHAPALSYSCSPMAQLIQSLHRSQRSPRSPTRSKIHSCRNTGPLCTSSVAAPHADSEARPYLCRHPPVDVLLAPPHPPALANEVYGLRLIHPALYFGHISIC